MSKDTPDFWVDLLSADGFGAAATVAAETETTIRVYTDERYDFAEAAAAHLHRALAALASDPVRHAVTEPSAVGAPTASAENGTRADSFDVELVR